MDCADRWVDVFITKAADDPTTRGVNPGETEQGTNYTYDDEFCATVQSIEFDPLESPSETAYITTNNSEWILPTWSIPTEYGSAAAAQSPYASLQVGDLVRIGGIVQEGFTDYLTIVEIRTVKFIANATDGSVCLSHSTSSPVDGAEQLPAPVLGGSITGNNKVNLSQAGIAHIAIRVNAALNCTILPDSALNRYTTNITHLQKVANQPNVAATLATRKYAYEYMSTNRTAYNGETTATECFYYPLYRAKNWTQGKELIARLDHGVKQVKAVKLLGYSLVNKRQVGIQHAHEMQVDDYLIMRIKEIEGHVISNNRHADNAFAVLRAGDTSNTIVGAAEFSSYEPNGIVCVQVASSNSTIRNMTVEIVDRQGRAAHFGRLHLWFKLLVSHG